MEWIAFFISIVALTIVIKLLQSEKETSRQLSKQNRHIENMLKERDAQISTVASRLALLIRMLRQHMKDGEILVEIGTANDKKLLAALQAAGIYVQFDEFPQTELGRSKVIAEMLGGEDIG